MSCRREGSSQVLKCTSFCAKNMSINPEGKISAMMAMMII